MRRLVGILVGTAALVLALGASPALAKVRHFEGTVIGDPEAKLTFDVVGHRNKQGKFVPDRVRDAVSPNLSSNNCGGRQTWGSLEWESRVRHKGKPKWHFFLLEDFETGGHTIYLYTFGGHFKDGRHASGNLYGAYGPGGIESGHCEWRYKWRAHWAR